MLKTWITGTKDFTDQGLAPSDWINDNVTIVDGGKLGKCMYFNGTSSRLSTTGYTLGNKWSWACWVKEDPSVTTWQGIIALNNNGSDSDMQTALWLKANEHRFEVCNNAKYNSTIQYTQGQWNHYAMSFDGTTTKAYLNGSQVATFTSSTIFSKTNLTIGARGSSTNGGHTSATNFLKGYINDLRIWDDEVISPLQVKQISQGLVLHYLLDNNSTYTSLINKTAEYTIYNNYGVVASLTATGDTYLNSPVRRLSMTPDSGHLSNFQTALHSHGVCNWTQTFTASTKYVFWIYYKPISHMDVRVGGTASNIGGWTEIKPKAVGNGWYVVGQYRDGSVTTDKTDNIFVSFYSPTAEANVPIQIDFACPTLVRGLTEIQPSINYNEENIIYDTSGFCYNGTINGNLSTSANTPRYLASTKFNGSEVITVPLTCGTISEALTVSCWGYEIDWNTPSAERLIGAATSSSGWCIGDYGSENTLFAFYANGSYNGATGFKQLSTGWHHFAITFDGLNLKYYVDGVEFNSRTFSSKQVVTGNYNINIGRHYGGGCYFKGNISDVRIYATALSAEDIQKLYSVSALIDSQGNTFASSYVEG